MDEGVVIGCEEQVELTSLWILLVIGSRMSRSCHQANQPMRSRVTPFISNVDFLNVHEKNKRKTINLLQGTS
jgi:hypothetical protein